MLKILIIHIIVSYDQNISLIFLCERWIPCQAVTSVLCLHYRPETVYIKKKTSMVSGLMLTIAGLNYVHRSSATISRATLARTIIRIRTQCRLSLWKNFSKLGNNIYSTYTDPCSSVLPNFIKLKTKLLTKVEK